MLLACLVIVIGMITYAAGMILWSGASVTKPDPNNGRGLGLAVLGAGVFMTGLLLLP